MVLFNSYVQLPEGSTSLLSEHDRNILPGRFRELQVSDWELPPSLQMPMPHSPHSIRLRHNTHMHVCIYIYVHICRTLHDITLNHIALHHITRHSIDLHMWINVYVCACIYIYISQSAESPTRGKHCGSSCFLPMLELKFRCGCSSVQVDTLTRLPCRINTPF